MISGTRSVFMFYVAWKCGFPQKCARFVLFCSIKKNVFLISCVFWIRYMYYVLCICILHTDFDWNDPFYICARSCCQDLVVRLCFVLGNLTAKNEQARLRLFQEKEAMDTLLTVLITYDEFDAQVVQTFRGFCGFSCYYGCCLLHLCSLYMK